MDKQTLSHYGWIVVMVLTLSVMLAFATPLGEYIGVGVSNFAIAMGIANDNAVKEDNIDKLGDEWEDYLGIDDSNNDSGDDSGTNIKDDGTPTGDPSLNPDDGSTPQPEQVYRLGNYEYCYGYRRCYYNDKWSGPSGCKCCANTCEGWAVRCINNIADPGPYLESINGEPITNMYDTFNGCTNLVNAPRIINTVTDMFRTFYGCTSLVIAPAIPDSVTNVQRTFADCTSLTTAPILPGNATILSCTFDSCTNLVTYHGSKDANGDFSNYPISANITNFAQPFRLCTKITIAPKLNHCTKLTTMSSAFSGCTSLTTAPTIPSNVTSIESALKNCPNLVTYHGSTDANGDFGNYIIPNTVTSMSSTFTGCTKLVTAPVIPASVLHILNTFEGCTSLTGIVTINCTKAQNIAYCFKDTVKQIVLKGSCTRLADIATQCTNNNVTVG